MGTQKRGKEFKVIEPAKTISVLCYHSAVYKEMEKEIVKKSKKKAAKKEVSTLGDIDALANQKEDE